MNSTTGKSSIKEKIIITIMIISVFAGIYIALNSWLKMKDHDYLETRTENRIIKAEKLVTDVDYRYFVNNKILPLLRHICETPELDIVATRNQLFEKYGLDISIYKFDKDNKLIETAPEKAGNQWLMKNLFPALNETDIPTIEKERKELDKKIEFTFGYGKNLISLKNNPETIINTVISGKESFAAWSKRANNGVIVVSNGMPNAEKVFAVTIDKMPKLQNLEYIGILKDEPATEEELFAVAANKYFTKDSLEYGFYADYDWYFVKNRQNNRYYMAYKHTESVYHRFFLYLKVLFIILVPLTLMVVFQMPKESIMSLRKLVILIFLASSILPLMIMGTASLESIDALANIHRNELRSAMEEAIDNIIQKFVNYKNNCTNRLNELTNPPNGRVDTIEDIKAIIEQVTTSFPNSRITARDAGSIPVYSNMPSNSAGQETLFRDIVHRYIEKYMPSRLDEFDYKGNPFTTMLLHKDDMGFNAICNYPNQMQFVKNAEAPMFWFIRLYPKTVGKIAAIDIMPDLTLLMKDYIKTIDQRSLVTNHQQINLTAYNPRKFRWSLAPQASIGQLFEQAKAAYVLNKAIFRRINQNGKQIYSICIPNSDYDEVCYLGSLATDNFQEEIRRQKQYISLGAAVALIMLLCIISWLMKQLISPLSDLEIGIKALAERKFETKLPVPAGKDELVTLFKEFNFMMGENYDMQMAKNVQEGLITTKFPQFDNYYVAGMTTPAGNLGGDCLTSFLMPDGKLLFLVGDLTGHSIGSALMMAFVRAVTFNWAQTPESNPASLAEAIDKLLRDNHTDRMFMGIVCGILDPKNGKLNFITRGHIFPLFLRNDGTAEWLGKPALPLGIGKKHETKIQETRLLPGERLLCISDGLVEVHKGQGLTTGYKLIEDWATSSINGDNEGWLTRIDSSFREWCKNHEAEQTDDLTLFTIISLQERESSYVRL